MIARLIRTANNELQLLCLDGSICVPNTTVLYNLLTNFSISDSFYGEDGTWKNEINEMSMVPGETLAIITDDKQLVISDFSPFASLVKPSNYRYLSVEQYATLHNRSSEMIKAFLRQNRIAGAQKVGKSWIIPDDAPYPVAPEHQREVSPNVGRPKKIK